MGDVGRRLFAAVAVKCVNPAQRPPMLSQQNLKMLIWRFRSRQVENGAQPRRRDLRAVCRNSSVKPRRSTPGVSAVATRSRTGDWFRNSRWTSRNTPADQGARGRTRRRDGCWKEQTAASRPARPRAKRSTACWLARRWAAPSRAAPLGGEILPAVLVKPRSPVRTRCTRSESRSEACP